MFPINNLWTIINSTWLTWGVKLECKNKLNQVTPIVTKNDINHMLLNIAHSGHNLNI